MRATFAAMIRLLQHGQLVPSVLQLQALKPDGDLTILSLPIRDLSDYALAEQFAERFSLRNALIEKELVVLNDTQNGVTSHVDSSGNTRRAR